MTSYDVKNAFILTMRKLKLMPNVRAFWDPSSGREFYMFMGDEDDQL